MTIEKQSRKSEARALESRALDNKKADEFVDDRVSYRMDYISQTHIPEHIKFEGYDYYWERTSVRGKPDYAVDNARRRGWTPVPISRDPGGSMDYLQANPYAAKFVCTGDVILMERPTNIGIWEKEEQNKISHKREVESEAYGYRIENPTKNVIR